MWQRPFSASCECSSTTGSEANGDRVTASREVDSDPVVIFFGRPPNAISVTLWRLGNVCEGPLWVEVRESIDFRDMEPP